MRWNFFGRQKLKYEFQCGVINRKLGLQNWVLHVVAKWSVRATLRCRGLLTLANATLTIIASQPAYLQVSRLPFSWEFLEAFSLSQTNLNS